MRGIEKSNFPAFFEAAEQLRARGHDVFNPAQFDVETFGFTVDGEAPEGWSLRSGLAGDLAVLCMWAEMVVLLPGWEKSAGCNAEIATAQALGLRIQTLAPTLLMGVTV